MASTRDSRAELIQTMSRLLRDQGYTATGRAQLLAESGVSNGSLYHHFPGGMEELADAALQASGQAVAAVLEEALDNAADTADGICRFLDIAATPDAAGGSPGCPIAPAALESPIVSPRLRATAAMCFQEWTDLIAARLRVDRWPRDAAEEAASTALALIEGALLLARVSADANHLVHAKRAAKSILTESP